jgi:hypothetical protein
MNENLIWHDIDELQLWQRNPNEGDIGLISELIKKHGWNDTCHFWNGIIKGGNHSIMALRQLRKAGWHPDQSKFNSTCLKIENGTWSVALIDVSEMSEMESDAFGLSLNKSQRSGFDDPAALAELLQEIHNSGEIALEASGFSGDDLDQILFDLNPHFEPVGADEQPRLDELKPIICPHCGKDVRQDG